MKISMKREFEEFCTSTSLHGWNRLTSNISWARQIFWVIIILFSMFVAGYFVWLQLNDFLHSTVEIRVDTTTAPLSDSAFPKMTICNSYKLRNSFMDEAFDPEVLGAKEALHMKHAFKKEFLTGYDAEEKESLNISGLYNLVNSDKFVELMHRECPYKDKKIMHKDNVCHYNGTEGEEDHTGLLITSRQSIYSMVLKFQINKKEYFDPLGTDHGMVEGTEDNLCYSIHPKENEYRIESGTRNGVEVLLDAEVFENADEDNPFSGFNLLLTTKASFPLMGLNGFSTPTGRSIKINIKPEIYKATQAARDRFSSRERMCIFEGEFTLKYPLPYSFPFCMALAAMDEMYSNCGSNVSQSIVTNKGVNLGCYNKYMMRVGALKTITVKDGQTVYCQKACDRQDNVISVSEQGFPNNVFAETGEFWLVVRKMFWSCLDRPSRHGFKRHRLFRKYPKICPFYDNFFYLNDYVVKAFESEDIGGFLAWQKAHLGLDKLVPVLGMVASEKEMFVDAILEYCRDNLVHITAYIGEPFIKVYITDEAISPITLVANMGGLLGLCMGFSLGSFAEIVYHLLVSPALKWLERKKAEMPSQATDSISVY